MEIASLVFLIIAIPVGLMVFLLRLGVREGGFVYAERIIQRQLEKRGFRLVSCRPESPDMLTKMRMYLVTYERPDGSVHTTRCWADSQSFFLDDENAVHWENLA